MRVKLGERSASGQGIVHLPSPFFHSQGVKEVEPVNIVKTTLSLLLSLFHPHVCAMRYFGPCAHVRGEVKEERGKEVRRHGSFPQDESGDASGNSRAHRQSLFYLSGFLRSPVLTPMRTEVHQ